MEQLAYKKEIIDICQRCMGDKVKVEINLMGTGEKFKVIIHKVSPSKQQVEEIITEIRKIIKVSRINVERSILDKVIIVIHIRNYPKRVVKSQLEDDSSC